MIKTVNLQKIFKTEEVQTLPFPPKRVVDIILSASCG